MKYYSCEALNGEERTCVEKLFFHSDTDCIMICQKTVEQKRRTVNRKRDAAALRRHNFDDYLNFSWTEITAHQVEKNIFASLYACL